MLKEYLQLPPHTQLFRGFMLTFAAIIAVPTLGAILSLLIGGLSLGTAGDGYFKFIVFLQVIVGIVSLILFFLLPIFRLLLTAHRFGSTHGRGDEPVIFYASLVILSLNFLFLYQPYLRTISDGATDQITVVLFFTGLIFGLLLSGFALVNMSKISAKVYSPVASNAQPHDKLKS